MFASYTLQRPELCFWACLRYKLAFVCDYFGGFEEEAAVLQVHHLSFQLVLHHIHQGQFINQLLHTSGKFTTHKTLLPLIVHLFSNMPVFTVGVTS